MPRLWRTLSPIQRLRKFEKKLRVPEKHKKKSLLSDSLDSIIIIIIIVKFRNIKEKQAQLHITVLVRSGLIPWSFTQIVTPKHEYIFIFQNISILAPKKHTKCFQMRNWKSWHYIFPFLLFSIIFVEGIFIIVKTHIFNNTYIFFRCQKIWIKNLSKHCFWVFDFVKSIDKLLFEFVSFRCCETILFLENIMDILFTGVVYFDCFLLSLFLSPRR